MGFGGLAGGRQRLIDELGVFGLAACGESYPNSTFNHHTEYNQAIDTACLHAWLVGPFGVYTENTPL